MANALKRVLFVGEHPFGVTGNSHMLRAILDALDYDNQKLYVTCFVNDHVNVNVGDFDEKPLPYKVIYATDLNGNDQWGVNKLVSTLSATRYDLVFFIGIDIWRYSQVFNSLDSIRQQTSVKYAALFPYDLQYIREDWIEWINFFDFKYVYSKYGESILKDAVPDIQYYRPSVFDKLSVLPEADRLNSKRAVAIEDPDDVFLFGYIGANQVRKDPQVILKAFSSIWSSCPKARLYMHTDLIGVNNLRQYAKDCGIMVGRLLSKQEGSVLANDQMTIIYNALDCLLLCSFQEGLSWTPIEAMACGVPCILSDSTSHKELKRNSNVTLIETKYPTYLPIVTKTGISNIDVYKCRAEDIAKEMKAIYDEYYMDKVFYAARVKDAVEFYDDWQKGSTDPNAVIESMFSRIRTPAPTAMKKDEVLFVQHSSAGDVLMTTQCFKGITERHKGKKFVYMTQKRFQGVVEGNPYIDEIIDYNVPMIEDYLVVYNPHGQKILPGGWNNLDVTLHSMYPYFCKVTADKPCIIWKIPDDEIMVQLGSPYVVVNTSGASKYRIYKHMDKVMSGVGHVAVQIGDTSDLCCKGAIDLRGKLSWQESAFVVAHAKAVVAVDSFCAHLAGAAETPAVVLFGPAPARVTKPRFDDPKKLICLEPNKLDVCPITSNCYGNPAKNVCTSPCINTINPLTVKQALLTLLKG